ncbi:MAG: hypothetical protein RI894_1813 [Bacteroidota bacterium]|jgi:alkaline phosphatase D
MLKNITWLGVFFTLNAITQSAVAQVNHTARLAPDPALAPFYHGVASGDPLSNAVIIWTRITTPDSSATVQWRMATDTGMTNIIQQGTAQTDATHDYCVKIDVIGLSPNTTYYYEFDYQQSASIRGRTKTLPVGDIDSLRFAIVSCSAMGYGYFNAYNRITARNDIDAVLHLGDYIYEYANGEFGSVRSVTPTNEILTLADYRMRHADYKLDTDLRRLHQQYPFITVWDDHETANDSWTGGAANHTEGTEGLFIDRRSYSTRAYFEWMPIRLPDPLHPQRIYRKFQFGDLMDLMMLDTRLEGREQQSAAGQTNTDPNRTLMGIDQFSWTCNKLRQSTARWKVLGNQVMMAPLKAFGQVLNQDQWDGYPAERQKLWDTIITHNITNFVVLTGDIHTSWGHDLPLSGYVAATGANSVGVEFVTTSVTSVGLPFNVPNIILQNSNPHCKYFETTKKGYLILDVNKQRAQGEWYYSDRVDAPSTTESFAAARYNLNGTRFLQATTSPSVASPTKFTTPAPLNPRFTGTENKLFPIISALDIYPNPLNTNDLTVRYYLYQKQTATIFVTDAIGRIIAKQMAVADEAGLKQERLTLPSNLAKGVYLITVKAGNDVITKKAVKL